MSELIKINYEGEQPTVSARDQLNSCNNFEDFFIKVCKLKVEMEHDELKELLKIMDNYYTNYNPMAIAYLKDCIQTELVLPCKFKGTINYLEKKMQTEIVNNFNSLFPDYIFVCTEKKVDGIGRIDIYALCGERPVIIELKACHKNPNGQLLAYATKFEEPILIGITQEPIKQENKVPGIKYLIFDELKSGVSEWII